MLIVETIAKIRRAFFGQGRSIKAICRELRVSRKVVRKVIRSKATEFRYEREAQPLPKVGPWRDKLDQLLLANEGKASRERLTLIRLFEELRGFGYDGGYDAVRRYARQWSKERGQATAAAYVPLSFAPGEAFQFDWSHEVVLLGGVTVIVKVAHVRLCHSRMLFVRAYPRETQEMVFDAHDRAFVLFKGACGRGIYDNMKTAVETVFVGKQSLYNRRFLQMCSHYLIEPVACTPASGWEKGQVENQVGLVRERFFTPRLRFKTYDEMNAWLLDKCIAYAKAHRHPELTERTIWEVFEAERPKLVPYAGRFDGFHSVPASVSKTCLVRFDNNKYSVAASAVGRPVEVHAYADRIVIRQDGRIVAEHPRSFGRGDTVYDPWHYVPVLARKPGALRNGAPFKDWVLPAAMERVRRKLASVDDGNRQMVDILTAVLTVLRASVLCQLLRHRHNCVELAAKLINALRRDFRREVLQLKSTLGFDVVSPGLAVSFLESSCRSKSMNRSGKGSSFWKRYNSRSSSAIAARIMARSSLCLGVVRRTGHVLPAAPPTRLLLYSGVRHAVFSVSVSRHGRSFLRFRHSRNS